MAAITTDEALQKIADYEKNTPGEEWSMGWEWTDVGVYSATLRKLLIEGYVELTYSSNRYKNYKLTDKGRAMLVDSRKLEEKPKKREKLETPGDLFEDIVGYDDIKSLFKSVITLDKPIHILLAGPPAIAKSLFLSEIERMAGQRAMWVVGSAASKAGLWDAIADQQPQWLLIDELEKMALGDMAGLLSLMETGRLVRMKVRRRLDIQVTLEVFAACNLLGALPPELRSRFAIKHLEQYNRGEFEEVVSRVLTRREDVPEEDASKIAQALAGKTQDVRDAVRVGRLSKVVGVDEAARLLIG